MSVRNADENVNVKKARVTIVSHIQFRMRCQREPTGISDKMVSRLSYGEKKFKKIIHAEICREIIRADGYVVWIPLLSFLRAIEKFKVHVFFSKKVFHKTKFKLVYFLNKDLKT